ncbi:DUF5994 family protein [Amycolatopsis sp. DG1A-15b]|uniref:DUF5994 family protein n=1 Tax=Amycolatopsis sp. DG1A-15b TaxID=3052846 RepID=UPI00255C160B|nr:DUF5994 family protein [Amycolatopsis sp. DG1A-15b]WIX92077.1 DUF5994 family protein [Amycolatopsis sp. DG1A-15b]
MPSGPNTTLATQSVTEPRLRLKPAAPATGHVDGGWWPRSDGLAAELPALLAAVAARLGRIDRVTYHLGDWPDPPRRVTFDGSGVRLEGFRSQAAGSLTVIGWNRHRTTLLVVPPETGPDAAQRALTTAADPDDTHDSAQLLSAAEHVKATSGAPLPS